RPGRRGSLKARRRRGLTVAGVVTLGAAGYNRRGGGNRGKRAVSVSSMTGFAHAEGEADGISWIWEVKSVNGRSLELRLRQPAGSAAAQPAAIRARLEALLAELSGLAAAIPEERVAQELAMLVSRADVREELDRLRAHIAQVADLFERGEAIGRQLDFLCQE